MMSGAVSPIARDIGQDDAREDAGQRRRQHRPRHRLPLVRRRGRRKRRERDSAPARIASCADDDDDRQHQERHRQRAGEQAPLQSMRQRHEQGQAENAVHDRGHAGQRADVELNQPGQPVRLGVFLQIDGRRHTEDERRAAHDQQHTCIEPTMADFMPACSSSAGRSWCSKARRAASRCSLWPRRRGGSISTAMPTRATKQKQESPRKNGDEPFAAIVRAGGRCAFPRALQLVHDQYSSRNLLATYLRQNIQQEGDDKQRRARRRKCMHVFDGTMGRVALADLHDISGHRLDAVQRIEIQIGRRARRPASRSSSRRRRGRARARTKRRCRTTRRATRPSAPTSSRGAERVRRRFGMLRGTALIASSLSEETIGMIMMPTTMPALSALKIPSREKSAARSAS